MTLSSDRHMNAARSKLKTKSVRGLWMMLNLCGNFFSYSKLEAVYYVLVFQMLD